MIINIIHRYFRGRWERYYFKNHWHLVLDLSLLMAVFILASALFYLYFYRPSLPGLGGLSRPQVDLNNPPLVISFKTDNQVIENGEDIDLSIKLKNDGAVAIKDISLTLSTLDNNFTIDKIENSQVDTSLNISGSKVSLPLISAHSSETISLNISWDRQQREAREIKLQTTVEYLLNGQPFRQTDSLPNINLMAEIYTQSGAYYTSPQGDQLGIGPIPPIVGIPTKYWIFWEVEGSDDLKNINLSARLPQDVELTQQRALVSGKFNYQTDTRQLIWNISDLKASEGPVRLNFEVQLTPNDKQIGQTPLLIENAHYFATDALTGADLSGPLSTLSTDLTSDRFNSGRGEVIAQ